MDIAISGHGNVGMFVGICAMSGLTGIADALVQGGIIGELSFMNAEFIQCFIAGSGASGVITSGLRFVTKEAFEKSKDGLHKGALMFFSISTFFELSCLLFYAFIFPRLQIIKHYRSKAASEGSKTVVADLAAGGIELSSHAKDFYLKIQANTNWDHAFYFTAKHGDQGWMLMLCIFLGLSNGYLTVCIFTNAPRGYKGLEQNAIGNLLVLFVIMGIFAGVILDWLWLIGKDW